jgi:hypothetical protein
MVGASICADDDKRRCCMKIFYAEDDRATPTRVNAMTRGSSLSSALFKTATTPRVQ